MLTSASRFLLVGVVVSRGVKVEKFVGMERTSAEAMIESWQKRVCGKEKYVEGQYSKRGDYSSRGMEWLKLGRLGWIGPYDCYRERAKTSHEVSYISFAAATVAAVATAACLLAANVYHER